MTTPEFVRFRLTLHYDGAAYHGWQLQNGVPTVQGEIEEALRSLTGERRPVTGSGRTDRGVHATGQVAAVDLPPRWSAPELRRALNALLPREIWVEEASEAAADFHPRFDAIARSYEYRVGTRREAGSPFFRPWCWDTSRTPPDRALLERCATLIPGERSFKKFAMAGQPERGERCRVMEAGWMEWSGPGLLFRIRADRYLHHMVRYLVGTMVEVAQGKRGIEELQELLANPDSPLTTSPPAPPQGLFLVRVEYPPEASNAAAGHRG